MEVGPPGVGVLVLVGVGGTGVGVLVLVGVGGAGVGVLVLVGVGGAGVAVATTQVNGIFAEVAKLPQPFSALTHQS